MKCGLIDMFGLVFSFFFFHGLINLRLSISHKTRLTHSMTTRGGSRFTGFICWVFGQRWWWLQWATQQILWFFFFLTNIIFGVWVYKLQDEYCFGWIFMRSDYESKNRLEFLKLSPYFHVCHESCHGGQYEMKDLHLHISLYIDSCKCHSCE